jgi:hypothetical protein
MDGENGNMQHDKATRGNQDAVTLGSFLVLVYAAKQQEETKGPVTLLILL